VDFLVTNKVSSYSYFDVSTSCAEKLAYYWRWAKFTP